EAAEADRDEQDTHVIDPQLGLIRQPRCPELRRIRKQRAREQQRDQSYWYVYEEHPAPRVVVCYPAPECRSDSRRGDDGNGIHGERRSTLLLRKRVDQNRLLDRCESASTRSLQHSEEDQPPEAGREATKQRTHGEQRHREQIIVLATHQLREPGAQGEHYGIRDKIATQDPRRLVLSCAQAAGNVRQ